MTRLFQGLATILLISFLSGCANSNSIHRKISTTDGSSHLIDVKQRAIISTIKKGDEEGGNLKTVTCAEPSPDALAAYAAEIAADADIPENVKAKFAAAFNESASYVGVRTHSVQLLRDNLYRLCEGYANGGIDEAEYQILSRRYQKYMVALMAIESLTGVIKVPTVSIDTKGGAEAGKAVSEYQSEIDATNKEIAKVDEEIKALNEQKTEAEKKPDNDKKTAELAKIDTALKANNERKNSLTENVASLKQGINSARGLTASASSKTTIQNIEIPKTPDNKIETVTAAVKEITMSIIDSDDTGQLCLAYLKNKKPSDTSDDLFIKNCNKHLTLNNELRTLKQKALQTYLEKNSSNMNHVQLKELVEMIDDEIKHNEIKTLMY